MSLLLDTRVALWAITGDPTLGEDFLERLRHDPEIFLSPVSLWEVTIKQSTGKVAGPPDLAERVHDMGFRELCHSCAWRYGRPLPPRHRGRFGRMLVAQAATEGLTLASRGASVVLYDVEILKA